LSAKDVVVTAMHEFFNEKDPAAVSRHFGPFTQHAAQLADGLKGLRELANSLPSGSRYELLRVLGDGDLVVTHGVYHGIGRHPLVGFDLWRVEGETIVEHWDALTAADEASLDDAAQADGPIRSGDADRTAANRVLVADWVRVELIGRGVQTGGRHESGSGDDELPRYLALHHIVAEGDAVFTRSEGDLGRPVICSDLWRVEDGRIVDRRTLVVAVPGTRAHANSVF